MAQGSHIKVSFGSVYHEGIDIGDGTVVHVLGKFALREDRNRIAREPLNVFSGGREIIEVSHSFSHKHGAVRSPEDIANLALDAVNTPYQYWVTDHNCEHFATSCVFESGPYSSQIESESQNLIRNVGALANFGRRMRFKGGPFLAFHAVRHGLAWLIREAQDCSFTTKKYGGSEYFDEDENCYVFVSDTRLELHDYSFPTTGWYTISDYGIQHLSEDPTMAFVSHHDYLYSEEGHLFYRGTSTDYRARRVDFDID